MFGPGLHPSIHCGHPIEPSTRILTQTRLPSSLCMLFCSCNPLSSPVLIVVSSLHRHSFAAVIAIWGQSQIIVIVFHVIPFPLSNLLQHCCLLQLVICMGAGHPPWVMGVGAYGCGCGLASPNPPTHRKPTDTHVAVVSRTLITQCVDVISTTT